MSRRTLVWGLVVSFALSLPVTYATPIEQTWISGIYDGGDIDALIFAIKCTKGLSPSDSPLLLVAGGSSELLPVLLSGDGYLSIAHPSGRAPPSSVSPRRVL